MRIRLQLQDNDGRKLRKVVFFLDEDACRNVSDICYLIKKKYYHQQKGTVQLYLDGEFLLPPQETVKVVQANDVFTVKFWKSGDDDQGRIEEISNRLTSGAQTYDGPSPKKRLTNGKQVSSEPSPKKVKNISRKAEPVKKQPAPKKESSSDSSSSSSSSSSDSSDSEDEGSKPVSKMQGNTSKQKETKTFVRNLKPVSKKSANVKKLPDTKPWSFVKPSLHSQESTKSTPFPKTPPSDKSPTLKRKNDSSSSSSKDSSEDSSDSSDDDAKNKQNKLQANSQAKTAQNAKITTAAKSKSSSSSSSSSDSEVEIKKPSVSFLGSRSSIDFEVRRSATSTPASGASASTTPNKKSPSNSNLNNSQAKQMIQNDSWTNKSSVYVSGQDKQAFRTPQNPDDSVSRKTLRNRKNRQRRKKAAMRNSINGGEDQSSLDGTTAEDSKCNGVSMEENNNKSIRSADDKLIGPVLPYGLQPDALKAHINGHTDINCGIDINGHTEMQEEKPHMNGIVQDEEKPESVQKDYSTYPLLESFPEVGDNIAFKILTLTALCQPVVSAYKEACVESCDSASYMLTLKLTPDSFAQLKEEQSTKNRFTSHELNNEADIDLSDVVSYNWNELIEPRRIIVGVS